MAPAIRPWHKRICINCGGVDVVNEPCSRHYFSPEEEQAASVQELAERIEDLEVGRRRATEYEPKSKPRRQGPQQDPTYRWR